MLAVSLVVAAAIWAALGATEQRAVTPNDEFFTLSISTPPVIDPDTYRLEVTGLVDHPLNFTYAQLRALPNVTELASLRCVTGLTGTAYWTGVTMPYFMQLIGVGPGARELVFYSADGYSTSLEVAELGRADVLLAWGMNNVTLPVDQGFPVKLVVPEDWGYKWAKWITRIEAVDYDYKGYWESRGWADDASISPVSDWQLHAGLLSIAAVLGAFSALSGLKSSQTTRLADRVPEVFPKRYHRYVSAAFYLVLFGTFIYWTIVTYEDRGAVFYSLHGRLALLAVAFSLLGAISGIVLISKPDRYRALHFAFAFTGYVLLLITIILGVLLAAG